MIVNQVLSLQALITPNTLIPVVALGTQRGCSARARFPSPVRAAESASRFQPRLLLLLQKLKKPTQNNKQGYFLLHRSRKGMLLKRKHLYCNN